MIDWYTGHNDAIDRINDLPKKERVNYCERFIEWFDGVQLSRYLSGWKDAVNGFLDWHFQEAIK